MDGSQFDSLMRVVGRVSTRRTTLRSALGGAAATAAAAVGFTAIAGDVAAKKKKCKKCPKCESLDFGQPCSTNQQCCTNETNMICAVPSNAGNSDTKCCGAKGFSCNSNDSCCGDFTCKDGFCSP